MVDDVFEENTPTNVTQGESSVPEVIKSVPSTSTIPKPDQKSLQVVHSTLPKYNSDDLASNIENGGNLYILGLHITLLVLNKYN